MIVFNPKTTNRIYSNDKFKELEGFLSPEIARVTLAEFLFNNLGFTVELLFNLKIYPFQEIILRSWFDHNFCLNIWGRGGSKCLSPNSLCITENGMKLLKNVNVGEYIYSNYKKNKILAKTENPIDESLIITTSSGYQIEGKLDHRCLVYDKMSLSFSFKCIKDISDDDVIVIRRGFDMWGDYDPLLGFSPIGKHMGRKRLILDSSSDLYYLIGLWIGDGCFSKDNTFIVTTGDEFIKNFACQSLQFLLPDNSIQIHKNGKNSHNIVTTSILLKQLFEFIGFDVTKKAPYKKIPLTILTAPKNILVAILQGLFDSDGTFHDGEHSSSARLVSTSLVLLKQVQTILLNLKITSSITISHPNNKNIGYTLSISGRKNLLQFREVVGFRLPRKQQKLLDFLNKNVETKYSFNENMVPDIGLYLGGKYKIKLGKNVSIKKLIQLSESNILDTNDKQKILSIVNGDCIFEKLKEKKSSICETIDIQVEDEECYWSNGFINHNSWLCAVFCCLYPIFYPRTRIVLASNAFRSTRRLIQQIERFINAKGADLLRQCYYEKKGRLEFVRRADEMTLDINEGQIIAIPLNEKVRGTRGDILIADEFLMVPEDIYKSVLMPFLTARNDIQEQLENKELRDSLLIPDDLSKEDLALVTSTKKIIGLTSASYDFEFVYRLYLNWIQKASKPPIGSSYFVSRIGYQALPESLIDKEIVEEAKSGGENTASFQREYMAIFSSSSDGYFNIKKLHDNTIRDGDLPCVQLKGSKEAKYILAIDPSFSDATTSDFFAMGVYLLNSDNRSITLVHTYARTGDKSELKDHIRYLYYLISCFNIVMIIGDFGGRSFNFIKACNESNFFVERNINLDFFEGNFDDEDYMGQLKVARNSYNLSKKKICYTQIYQRSEWIRKANEHLKTQIESGKVHFASRLTGHEQMFKNAVETEIPVLFKDNDDFQRGILDFIADQDDLIEQTKRQLALIEPKVTSTGVMQFDLPQHLRQSKSPSKARRDCYSCMVMGSWAARCFYDLTMLEDEPVSYTFDPILI